MTHARFAVTLRSGETINVHCSVTKDQLAQLQHGEDTGDLQGQLIREVLADVGRSDGLVPRLASWRLMGFTSTLPKGVLASVEYPMQVEAVPDRPRRVVRCRSLLHWGCRALPAEVRDEALDEWMDEIECAGAEEQPVFRRAVSILLRSLPALIWRSRLPARVRRGGS